MDKGKIFSPLPHEIRVITLPTLYPTSNTAISLLKGGIWLVPHRNMLIMLQNKQRKTHKFRIIMSISV